MAQPKYPGIPSVAPEPSAVVRTLQALKEGLEIGQRVRGDPLDSFVRLRELVDLGVATVPGGGIVSPTSVDWSNVINTPTTLAGYGITNAYTKAEADALFLTDAPIDDTTYGRQNGGWVPVDRSSASAYGSWQWASGSTSPTWGQFSTGAQTNPLLATEIRVNQYDRNGINHVGQGKLLKAGDAVYVQGQADTTAWVKYRITGPGVVTGTFSTFPVTVEDNGPGSLVSWADLNLLFLLDAAPSVYVHSLTGTASQVDVDNTDPYNPVVSLAASVLASLGLANSALQPAAIGVSVQPYHAVTAAWATGDTPSAFTLGIVDSVDAAAWRSAIGAGAAYTPAALTKTDDTNVTLTLGGTPSTALLQATSLTLGWTGTLATGRGGTGISTYTTGDLLYASATNVLSKLAAGTNTHVLTMVAGVPAWAAAGSGSGTVTSVGSGAGLTGGPITTSGFLAIDYTANAIWSGVHQFIGTPDYVNAYTGVSLGSDGGEPSVWWRRGASATNEKMWAVYLGSNYFQITHWSDAGGTPKNVYRAYRSANTTTAIYYGNSDLPPHYFDGSIQVGAWSGTYDAARPIRIGVSGGICYFHAYDGAAYQPVQIASSNLTVWANSGVKLTVDASASTFANYIVHTNSYHGLGVWIGAKYSSTNINADFILQNTASNPESGFYSVTHAAWLWRWTGSTLSNGTVPYANLSGVGTAAQYNASSSNTASTVVLRDGNGDHTSRYVNANYFNQSSAWNEDPAILSFSVQNTGNDSYHRWASLGHVINTVRGTAGYVSYFWSQSHPANYYLVNNWDGTYWQITSNHGAGVRVAYADNAGAAGSITRQCMWTYHALSSPITGTNGAWTTAPLNATGYNSITSASMSSSTFSLPAGTYLIVSSLVFQECSGQMRLYNSSDSTVILNGPRFDLTEDATCSSTQVLSGIFTLASTKSVRVEYYKSAGSIGESDGGGGATMNVHSVLIEKIA